MEKNGIEAKIILLGDSGVGKTNLIRVTVGEKFNPNEDTTMCSSLAQREFIINGNKNIANLWDTAGQEKYSQFTHLFLNGSDIVIFVYSITDEHSFERLNFWIKYFKENINSEEKYICGIVGNKKDLFKEEKVSETKVKQFANLNKMKYEIVSAKEGGYEFINFLDELLKDSQSNLYAKKGIKLKKVKTKKSKKFC